MEIRCLEVYSKTTFPTFYQRHLVLCASSLLSLSLSMATERTSGFQTRRTAAHDAPLSFLLTIVLIQVRKTHGKNYMKVRPPLVRHLYVIVFYQIKINGLIINLKADPMSVNKSKTSQGI